MRKPGPLPESLDPRGFATRAALRAAVSEKRLRASDLDAPFHGVRRMRSGAADPDADVRALAARLLPGQFLSHLSAARLLGMRLPSRLRSGVPHVAVRAPGRTPRIRGARGHVVPAGVEVVEAVGISVTSPLDTWISLAGQCSVEELVLIGDGLVGGRRPSFTIDDLERAVRRSRGLTGIRKLRLALLSIRERTDSAKETELRLLVLRLGFPEPEVNGEIRDRRGRVIAHGDLVFRARRTILEYDGGHHRTDARQFAIDIRRLDDIMAEGWRVIRVDSEMLRDVRRISQKLRQALDRSGSGRDLPREGSQQGGPRPQR